jgi:hypothetical protein
VPHKSRTLLHPDCPDVSSLWLPVSMVSPILHPVNQAGYLKPVVLPTGALQQLLNQVEILI